MMKTEIDLLKQELNEAKYTIRELANRILVLEEELALKEKTCNGFKDKLNLK